MPEKRKGPPLKFTEDMLKKIIVLMAEGKSKGTVCKEMGINIMTQVAWTDPDGKYYNPKFAEVIKMGEQLAQSWWEETGRLNIHNKDFNSTLFMMNMQNRFGWTRRLEGKLTKEEIHTERKELIVEIKNSDETIAEIGNILASVGAIKSQTKDIIDTEVN